MRKRILTNESRSPERAADSWLDLEKIATVEVTSEDSAAPVESALIPDSGPGWRAAAAGEQTIRLVFDAPQNLRRVQVAFVEETQERSQEMLLSWSAGEDEPLREIARQQFNFNNGSPRELEDWRVELQGVKVLELKIIPDRSGGGAIATLERLRAA